MEVLRCGDCKSYCWSLDGWGCYRPGGGFKKVNPGQFACIRFVYPDK